MAPIPTANQWQPGQAAAALTGNVAPDNSYTYNINPAPQSSGIGASLFGSVPGAISLPKPVQDLSKVYPNLTETGNAVSGDIGEKLAGQLAPDTLDTLQDRNAEAAVAGGMPGSGLFNNNLLAQVGKASQQQQAGGLGDYSSTIPAVSTAETVAPNFQAELAMQNAINAAAPNPFASAAFGLGNSALGFGLGGGYSSLFGGGGTITPGQLTQDLDTGNAFGMGSGFETDYPTTSFASETF